MRKSRTPGSVRGVSGNGYPYRDNIRSRLMDCQMKRGYLPLFISSW